MATLLDKKNGLLLFLMLLSFGIAHAQTPVFEAFTDARQVLADQYFTVTFTLKNADANNFRAPDFSAFAILSGPARGISTTIVNGKVSREISYSYTLQPKRQGNLTIGAATISAGNQQLKTQPITIEVLPPQAGSAPADQPFFVTAELSHEQAYMGQQVRLDYKLYTTVEIQNYNIVAEPDYIGFYAEDIQRPDTRQRREIHNGVQYTTRVIKSIALYPQQTGQLSIDPATLQLSIIIRSGRSSSIFFGNEIRRKNVQTPAVDLTVLPLPPGAPASFTGAVGNFTLSTSVSRQTITTDDAVSLVMNIEGDGDLKRVQVPSPDFPASFTAYEPKVQEANLGERNSSRIGRKIIEYVAIPKAPGQYSLTPSFSFFHPDSSRYITLNDASYDLVVRPGSSISTPILSDEQTTQSDIHDLKMDTRLRQAKIFLWDTPAYWIVLLLPVLLLSVAIYYKKQGQKRAGTDPAHNKMQAAQKVAERHLEQAVSYQQEAKSHAFYDEISKAMMGYVSDKLQLEKSQMNKSNLQQRLESLQIPESQILKFMEILRNCEMALYAGKANNEAMQTTYDNAREVLATIENQLAE